MLLNKLNKRTMKNLILPILMILAVATTQAQKRSDRAENRKELGMKMEPQEIASIQAKKMTLQLDLSDKQEAQVEKLLTANAAKRKELMASRADRKEMSKEEKLAMAEQRMDEKIATKRAMKDILNAEQYEKFEKMAQKRDGKRNMRKKKMSREKR